MAILIDPSIAGGDPHVAGTALSVYHIEHVISSRLMTRRELLEDNPRLSETSVSEALAYARSHPKKQLLFG